MSDTKNLLESIQNNLNEDNITLDDIYNEALELGYEVLYDDRDEEGKTILIYKPESNQGDYFDSFDNKELYQYLSTIPAVRYEIDSEDPSTLAIWLNESINESDSNETNKKYTVTYTKVDNYDRAYHESKTFNSKEEAEKFSKSLKDNRKYFYRDIKIKER